MANLIRWYPVPDTRERQDEFELLLNDNFGAPTLLEIPLNWGPALDILESEDNFMVRADIPNVEPQTFDISLNNNVLTIRGQTKTEKTKNGTQYHMRERHFGHFSRTVTLPATVDPDVVEAYYEQGTLNIVVAKVTKSKPHPIPVRFNTPEREVIGGS